VPIPGSGMNFYFFEKNKSNSKIAVTKSHDFLQIRFNGLFHYNPVTERGTLSSSNLVLL
jgi:hypothetical protein